MVGRQEGGIQFLDRTGSDSAQITLTGHFRSSNLASVRLRVHVQQIWETCMEKSIELPAKQITHYTSEGDVGSSVQQPCQEDVHIQPNSP